MNRRANNAQNLSIETLLISIEKKYLTREKMYNRILYNRSTKDKKMIDIVGRIDIIDSVRENVKTSLQFNDYKRASWYLQLLLRLCEKYFDERTQ